MQGESCPSGYHEDIGVGGLSGQLLVPACGKESMVPMEWETGWALKSIWHFGQATKISCSCSESSHNISVIESAHSSLPLSLLTVYLNHLHCCVVLKLNTFHDHWHGPFTIYVYTMVLSDITFSKGIAFLLFQSVVAFVLVFTCLVGCTGWATLQCCCHMSSIVSVVPCVLWHCITWTTTKTFPVQ